MNALHALVFGFTLAIAIGPIALLIIHNGINHGLPVAVRSGVGAAAADLVYSLLAFVVGSSVIAALTSHAQLIRVVSALLLIGIGAWLAWKALHSLARQQTAATSGKRGFAPGFWTTFGLTLANPLTLVIFIGFAGQLSPGGDSLEAFYYSVCIFLGSLIVQMGLALLGASIGKWLANPRVIAVLNFASGAAIVAFGLRGLMVVS
jgi:threonine/homoserine/homoserine lactone efflux protein